MNTYDSNTVPVYYVVADAANVSILTGPADVANECTMYLVLRGSSQQYIYSCSMDELTDISTWKHFKA